MVIKLKLCRSMCILPNVLGETNTSKPSGPSSSYSSTSSIHWGWPSLLCQMSSMFAKSWAGCRDSCRSKCQLFFSQPFRSGRLDGRGVSRWRILPLPTWPQNETVQAMWLLCFRFPTWLRGWNSPALRSSKSTSYLLLPPTCCLLGCKELFFQLLRGGGCICDILHSYTDGIVSSTFPVTLKGI